MLRSRVCAAGEHRVYRGATSRPMAHRKAAISRAIAATTTGGFFARGAEAAITSAQTHLRLPGDVTHWLGQPFEPRSQGLADPRWITIGPSRLDERSPRSPIAGQSEALPSDCVACRAFRRDKPEERCELSWRVEPAHVADLSGKGHGHEKRSATHGLIGFHYWRHGPLRHNEGELPLDATQALKKSSIASMAS